LAEAKSYARLELACALADKAIDVTYLSWPRSSGHFIDTWLQTYPLLADVWTLRLMALFLVVIAIHSPCRFR